MSTYHLPGKGIPAILRRAAGLPKPGGSKAKTARSFTNVVGMAQVAVKVYRNMLRTLDEPSPPEPGASPSPPSEAERLRQRDDNVWLAFGLVGRDLVADPAEAGEAPSEEFLRMVMLEEVNRGILVEKLRRIVQTLQRWLNLFALFLLRFFFFEFPNNLRHLCTTMPWSIWPALVVLWGVCWMFYGEGAGGLQPYESEVPEVMQNQFSTLPGQAQPSASPLDLGVPTPPTAMTPASMQGNSLPVWDNSMILSPQVPRTFGLEGSTMLSPVAYDEQALCRLWSDVSPMLNTAGLMGGAPAALSFFLMDPLPTPKEAQVPGPSMAQSLGTPPTSPAVPAGHGNTAGGQEPGGRKCDKPSSEGLTSESENGLRRYRARRNRSVICTACNRLIGSNADLIRHRRTVHKEGLAKEWYCTEPSCSRTRRAFNRKDNYDRHMEAHRRKGLSASPPSDPAAEGSGSRMGATARKAESGRGSPACDGALRRENEKLREENAALRKELEAKSVDIAQRTEREVDMWATIRTLRAFSKGL